MEKENKESAESVKQIKPFWINLFIIRHIAAVARLLLLIFWRNNFGHDSLVMPSRSEIDEIYDIWFGNYSGVSIEDMENVYHMDKAPPIPNAIYLKVDDSSEKGRTVVIPLLKELTTPMVKDTVNPMVAAIKHFRGQFSS